MTKADSSRRKANPSLAMLIRQLHAYFSMLIAPTLLFFAVTGGLQVYSFHEDHGAYQSPMILQELGAVHKDQVFEAKKKKGPLTSAAPGGAAMSGPAAATPPGPPRPRRDKQAGLPLKVAALKLLFALAAVGLVIGVCLGVWMGLKYTRKPVLCGVLLVLGVVLPLATFLLP
jgi:hypothetical protein